MSERYYCATCILGVYIGFLVIVAVLGQVYWASVYWVSCDGGCIGAGILGEWILDLHCIGTSSFNDYSVILA